MRLRTLGELTLEGSSFKRAKPLLLLAYLAIEGTKERRFLRELLWRDAKDAHNSLSTALLHLRRVGSDVVSADEVRAWSEAECDAVQLLASADENDNEWVVELYQSPFLEGVDPSAAGVEVEEWIYATREALGAQARRALLNLAEDHARVGEFEQGAGLAQRAYLLPGAPEPEQGELERLFVLLTAAEHREALEVRKEAAAYDLDLNLSVEDARAALHKDAATTGNQVRHNLPVQPTPFVGREAEITKLSGMLNDPDCRLLTIVGPGGFGKTRLAIEVARQQLGSFPDGVVFVPFASVTSITSMPSEITRALGLHLEGAQDATAQLFSYLEDKSLLLVLDNLEHLLGSLDLIHDLWEKTESVQLLITSREPLNLQAERVFVLSGLTAPAEVPVEQSDAVTLFMQTARNRGYEVALSGSTTPSVVRICKLVGGMPLAIELAASWLKALTVDEIAQEISRGIDVLQASTRDVPERHRSIRAVFGSSWELLSESEREVLRRLTVFRGRFKRDAATVVAGASLFTLGGLVDKSFLTLTPSGRYEQHPLVQQYALERLAEHPLERAETQQKHGNHYLNFLQEHAPKLSSSNYKQARALLEPELPNLRAAWDWAIDQQQPEQLKSSAFALSKLHEVTEREPEGVELFAQAAASFDESDPEHRAALGYVLIGQSAVGSSLAFNLAEGASLLERGLELLRPLGEELGVAWALSWLPTIRSQVGDEAQAQQYLREGFPIARRMGNAHLLGRYLNQQLMHDIKASGISVEDAKKLLEQNLREQRELGDPYQLNFAITKFGDYLIHHQFFGEGKALLTESLELTWEIGEFHTAGALRALGKAALAVGDLDEAEVFASEALQVTRDRGVSGTEFLAVATLGVVAIRRGRLAEAERLLTDALRIARGTKNLNFITAVLVGLAELKIAQGHEAVAAEGLAFILQQFRTFRFDWIDAQRSLDGLGDRLPPEELAAAVERGKELSLEDVINELLPTV